MAAWWEEYEGENAKHWRKKLSKLPGAELKNAPPRSLWGRFIDSIDDTLRHYGPGALIARQLAPMVELGDGSTREQRKEKIVQKEREWREVNAQKDPADSVGDYAADFAGGIVASGLDPTNIVGGPAKTVVGKMANAAGIGFGADAVMQASEIGEGVRDEYDPVQGAINVAAGPAIIGGAHAVGAGRRALNGRSRSKAAMQTDAALMPVKGRITSGFGYRRSPKAGASSNHQGVDIAAAVGTRVLAPAAGRVSKVGRGHSKRGNWVEIEHPDGTTSRYLHLQNFSVKPGDVLGRGDIFAKTGATGNVTGPHLHWSLMKDGKAINPLNHQFADARASAMTEVNAAADNPRVFRRAQREYGLDDESMAAMQTAARSADNSSDVEAPLIDETTGIPRTFDDDGFDQFGYNRDGRHMDDFDTNRSLMDAQEDALTPSAEIVDFQQARYKAAQDTNKLLDDIIEDMTTNPKWELTPAERQDMDASVPDGMRPAPLDNYSDRFTAPLEERVPANDTERDWGAKFDRVLAHRKEGLAHAKAGNKIVTRPEYEAELREIAKMINEANRTPEYKQHVPKLKEILKVWREVGDTLGFKTDLTKAKDNVSYLKSLKDMLSDDSGTVGDGPKGPLRLTQAVKGEYTKVFDRGSIYDSESAAKAHLGPGDEIKYSGGEGYYIYNAKKDAYRARAPKSAQQPKEALSSRAYTLTGPAKLFDELAKAQRDRPEMAMLRAQKVLGQWPSGNALGYAMEHVGDISHRMAENGGKWNDYGIEFVAPKIRTGLRVVTNPVDSARIKEIPDIPELKAYAEEHAKLPVYNDMQKAARDAAVALGNRDFDAVIKNLNILQDAIDDGTYVKKAGFFNNLIDLMKDDSGSVKIPESFKNLFRKKTTDGTPDPDAPEIPAAIKKVTETLNAAKPLRRKQERMYQAERRERLKKVVAARRIAGGEAGYHAELAALKGDFEKVDFTPIRDKFEQPEIDALMDYVNAKEHLNLYDGLNAKTGITKLMAGVLPTANEIALLEDIFPKDMISALLKNQSMGKKFKDFVSNAVNLPRTIMSSMDLSAPFRQGLFLIRRKAFWKAFGTMFRALGSEDAYNAIKNEIRDRPSYKLMMRGGLALSDIGKVLEVREEQFLSSWGDKLPGVKQSNRAYVSFLNKVRADVFDDMVARSKDAGINVKNDSHALHAITRYINAATGRGNLHKSLKPAAEVLAGVLFSPRLMASRVALLNPAFYVNLARDNPIAAKEAVKDLVATGGLITSVLSLAAASGAEVETDPRSSDFAKIKIGKTRFDIAGGFQQYLKLAAQIWTGEKVTSKGNVIKLGEGYRGDTRRTVTEDFFYSKFAPIASYISDAMEGKNPIGEPFEPVEDALQRFIPLFMQDLGEAYKEYGAKGLLTGVPAIFGVGVSTYGEREKAPSKAKPKSGDWWSEFESADNSKSKSAAGDNWWKEFE